MTLKIVDNRNKNTLAFYNLEFGEFFFYEKEDSPDLYLKVDSESVFNVTSTQLEHVYVTDAVVIELDIEIKIL